ncbi:MAG: FAD-dependent oxidoreductase [Clostridia bacterium]|nr:FAD-dependent oxidoreductase [Clostridia bacterium]
MGELRKLTHKTELCVIGGGIAGMLTAIAAARHGTKVVLMHDRPVLGGNASSEIKMWICGAGSRVRGLQETGIIEEILLENMHRNPTRNYSLWDSILYEKVRFEPNITLLLNCACLDAEMDGSRIKSVTGFQLTTYTYHTVAAEIFADCSGDSILAPLTGAEFMRGKEARREYNEEFAPEEASHEVMGMSLLIEARETDHPCPYTPPSWAYTYRTDEEMHFKPHEVLEKPNTNFYWIELGGEMDTIHDTEEIRDELLKIAFGVWDHMKNQGDHGAENWELTWIGFLPGKRESLRYKGDYVLTQNDVEGAARFDDTVAYGGWQIDDHLSGGFYLSGKNGGHLRKRRLMEPYCIPLRSLYSVNIDNLMFAGRNISATHFAFASTRVMATCGIVGQAVGTAAHIALRDGLSPREAAKSRIGEIQRMLMEDDCWLPHLRREPSALTKRAKLTCEYGDGSALTNGLDRRVWGNDNGYFGRLYRPITFTFDAPEYVAGMRLVLDSDLDRENCEGNPDLQRIPMPLFKGRAYNNTTFGFPRTMLRAFRVEVCEGGEWRTAFETEENYQRFVRIPLDVTAEAVRLIPLSTYGNDLLNENYGSGEVHIFGCEVY